MSSYPADLRYTRTHEWVRFDGDIATCGLTWYAQDQLGDVVYVDLPGIGDEVAQGRTAGEVESVKAVSDIYAPLSGEVVEVNGRLKEAPETVNEDPYGAGWLFKIRVGSPAPAMLDADAYAAHVAAQSD